MKNLLKMSDLSPAELTHILDVADQLKADCKAGRTAPLLAGKSVALLFSKASTRTRTSFEVGVYQMGGLGNYMNTAELQAGRGEPLRDTARVLGRYYDCAVWRTYRQRDLEELAELSGIPVINGLTDYAHPCQVLADLMTIRERRGTLAGLKLCFVGDGSNMANSLIVGGLLAGMQVSCVCPPGYRPAADVLMFAHKYGNAFHLTTDPAEIEKTWRVLPMGYWKGSGLSIALDLIATVLTNGNSVHTIGTFGDEIGLTQIMIAIDPAKFNTVEETDAIVDAILADVKSSEPVTEGGEVYYPGELELKNIKENKELGVPVIEEVWESVLKM